MVTTTGGGRGTHRAPPTSSRVGSEFRGRFPIGAATALLVLSMIGWLAVPSAAAAATAGTAQITVPGTSTLLRSGGSDTPYGVALPQGAGCPGDTAHKGYHVFSYLVPKGVSPTAVSFKTGVPSRWFGYIAEGAYYGAINTAENTGQIVELPGEFTWSRLTPHDLFDNGQTTATWEGGLACANVEGVVTNYWNTAIVFRAQGAASGGFTWSVLAPPPATGGLGVWLGVGLLLVAIALAGIAIGLRRRRTGDRQHVVR